MKSLFLVLIIVSVFVIACSEKKSETGVKKDAIEEMTLLDSINNLTASAARIYEIAIKDVRDGIPKDSVVLRYEKELVRANREMSRMIDRASREFILEKRSQQDYDSFMRKIDLSLVRRNSEELEALGIVFNLE